MRFYSHLSEDERDQIGVLRAAGRSMGVIAWALGGRKQPSPGSCSGTHSPRAGIRRFTPPEPINCAGGVKRSSNEKPLYVCSCVIGSPGMDARQISGWLKSGNEPRLRAIFDAAITSLNTMRRAVSCDSAPFMRTVRCLTVANTLSIGFEVRKWSQ